MIHDNLLDSPWLPDWRQFYDEVENISPKGRRILKKAIETKTQEWEAKHEASYRERFRKNRDTRKAKVFDACDELTNQLKQIRAGLGEGRLSPAQARAKLREINGRHQQITELHDTLVQEDEAIEEFADLTADEFQRQTVEQFPVLMKTQPTLAAFAHTIDPPPPPGGAFQQLPERFRPGLATEDNAPSAEDLTVY